MSIMLTIINVICSWVGLFAGAGYIYACARGMMRGEVFTPMAIALLVISAIVAFSCGSWIICH